MKFIETHKDSGELTKIAIKKIYEALKKRKLYSLFKRTYNPLKKPIKQAEIDRILLDKRKPIYFFKGEERYVYHPDVNYNYSKLELFELYKIVKYILTVSQTLITPLQLTPDIITGYVLEDYFAEKNKKNKPHITDIKFTVLFGLFFVMLGIICEALACYFIVPKFLGVFLIFLLITNILGCIFAFGLKT